MSWAANASLHTDEIESVEYQTSPERLEGEPYDAFRAADGVARTLVSAGVLGEGEIAIHLGGHANPGHVREDPWAPDQVTVQIRRTDQ